MYKLFAVLLLVAAVVAISSAQYVYSGYGAYPAYTSSYGYGYAGVPAYTAGYGAYYLKK